MDFSLKGKKKKKRNNTERDATPLYIIVREDKEKLRYKDMQKM